MKQKKYDPRDVRFIIGVNPEVQATGKPQISTKDEVKEVPECISVIIT